MISSVVAACAALLAVAQSGGDTALQTFNAYAPMHIGVDVRGLDGIYRLDAPGVVAAHRFTAQSSEDLAAVWLFYRTVGKPGPFEMTVYASKPGDPALRDSSKALCCVSVTPHAAAASATWERVPLGPEGARPIARGEVLHVVLEPAVGATFDAHNRVELITTRARWALTYLPLSRNDGRLVSIADDALAFLYARGARTPRDARVQRSDMAVYLPIFAVESSGGALYGQPCDVHLEETIWGSRGFGEVLRLPGPVTFDFVAMYTRGAGEEQWGRPSDDLYLDIVERDLQTGACIPIVSRLIMARKSDKLFKKRSHWYGQFLGGPVTIVGGPTKEYGLILSSPRSTGADTDAWVYSAEGSTLEPLAPGGRPSFGMDESRACAVKLPLFGGDGASGNSAELFQELGPATDAAFRLGLFGARGPCAVALLDEVLASSMGPDGAPRPGFPLDVKAGDYVWFEVRARNIGIDTVSGGPIFARFVDRASGRILDGPDLYSYIPENNERGEIFMFTMPPTDLVLSLEIGHLDVAGGSGLPIVDDVTTWEIRVR